MTNLNLFMSRALKSSYVTQAMAAGNMAIEQGYSKTVIDQYAKEVFIIFKISLWNEYSKSKGIDYADSEVLKL